MNIMLNRSVVCRILRPGTLLCMVLFLYQTTIAKVRSASDSIRSHWQLSLNLSDPILRMVELRKGFDSSLQITSPMIYIGRETRKNLFRLGLSANWKQNTDQSDVFVDKRMQHFLRTDITLSWHRLKSVYHHVSLGMGVQCFASMQRDRQRFDSGFDEVLFNRQSMGLAVGPSALLRYQISKRFSFFTEYVVAYQFRQTFSRKEFSSLPDQNYDDIMSREHRVQTQFPLSILFTYHIK